MNYALPNSGRARLLTNGWTIDGLLRISSGKPYNIVSFADYNNSNEFIERPDVVAILTLESTLLTNSST